MSRVDVWSGSFFPLFLLICAQCCPRGARSPANWCLAEDSMQCWCIGSIAYQGHLKSPGEGTLQEAAADPQGDFFISLWPSESSGTGVMVHLARGSGLE
jgi:hypothetical protein